MCNVNAKRPVIILKMDAAFLDYIYGNIDADIVIVDQDTQGISEDEISILDGERVSLSIRRVDTRAVSQEKVMQIRQKAISEKCIDSEITKE